MEFAIDKKGELEIITDEGFVHIEKTLGYEEGNLLSWTTEGENLSYKMGTLIRRGIQGYEMKKREVDLLSEAIALINRNRQNDTADRYEMDSSP